MIRSVLQYISSIIILLTVLTNPLMGQYTETGMASYYNDALHGNPTASGELYDKNAYTCAHLTLPFGTMLRVTNLANGQYVDVRVNDRGPHVEGRIVDLSRAAASRIGLIRAGIARVRIQIQENASYSYVPKPTGSSGSQTPPPTTSSVSSTVPRDLDDLPLRDHSGTLLGETGNQSSGIPANPRILNSPGGNVSQVPVGLEEVNKYTPSLFQFIAYEVDNQGFGVQVGAYFSYYKLLKALDDVSKKGFQNTMVHNSTKDGKPVFRILVGPYDRQQEAAEMKAKLAQKRVKGIVVDLATLK